MRIIETKVSTFDELDEKAKRKAREWFFEGVFDFEWYKAIYDDAENIGLRINNFDCDRRMIDGELDANIKVVCKNIMTSHGKTTDTYKLAKTMDLRRNITIEVEKEFKRALLEEYLAILTHEVEYMQSNEYVDESIRANEYEFTADGGRA